MKVMRPRNGHRPFRLSGFVQQLEDELRRLDLAKESQTVLVAVSGGADSTALLIALDELIKAKRIAWTLLVAHLDHRLRTSSRADAAWVIKLAEQLGHTAIARAANIRKRASESSDNLEQAARKARYEFFAKVAKQEKASIVLTAHTLDDQAETVLLRLLRGSAAEGLAGMEPLRPLTPDSHVFLCRPMLTWCRRADTARFCGERKIEFRPDVMNDDERFARVRVRKQLLPLMQTFNKKAVEALARSATLLREDANVLSDLAEVLLKQAGKPSGSADGAHRSLPPEVTTGSRKRSKATPLNVRVLEAAPPAIRRRAVRHWLQGYVGSLRRLEMVHFLAIERLIEAKGGRTVELPNGIRVRRQRDWLYLSVKTVEKGGVDL